MKNQNEVLWLSATAYTTDATGKIKPMHISYTHEEYKGSTAYVYRWEHIPSNAFGYSVIYGVSVESGDLLVKKWAATNPAIWKYDVVKQN